MSARKAQRGFTLIELMMVVAIIGIMTSVAMPTFQRLTMRSKAAERPEIMLRIKKAVADYYVQHGTTLLPSGDPLKGDPQPAGALAPTKRMPNYKDPTDGWIEIFRTSEEIMGSLYYQYDFDTDETAVPPTLTIRAIGDLDSNGLPCTWTIVYERRDGVYQVLSDTVVPSEEEF